MLKECERIAGSNFAVISCPPDKYNAFHATAKAGNTMLVHFLLQHGIDATIQDEDGNTALHYAAARVLPNLFLKLANFYIDINVANSQGNTVLHLACEHLNLTAIARLVKVKHLNIGLQNKNRQTSLHVYVRKLAEAAAVDDEALKVLKQLCRACEDVACLDEMDSNQETAFDILMKAGVDVGIKYFRHSASSLTEVTVERALKHYSQKPSVLRTLLQEFGAKIAHRLAWLPCLRADL